MSAIRAPLVPASGWAATVVVPTPSVDVIDRPVVWGLAWAAVAVATWRPRAPARRPTDPSGITVADHPAVARSKIRARTTPRITETVALAQWCEEVARSLRSGSTLAAAIGEAPPPASFASELGPIATSLLRGRRIDTTAIGTHPDLALVVGVIAACDQHGGAAAEPLDRAASVLRGRAAEAAERQTQSAQARLSARVMTLLPVAVLGVLLVSSASVRHVVITPTGASTVVVGVLLNLTGWRWLRHLVDRASA